MPLQLKEKSQVSINTIEKTANLSDTNDFRGFKKPKSNTVCDGAHQPGN